MHVAAIALTAVSAVVSAVGAIAQGNAQADAANANAAIMRRNAQAMQERAALEEQQGLTAAARQRRQTLALRGRTMAALANAGVDLTEGSPLELDNEQVKEGEFQALQAKFEFDQRAWQMRVQADDMTMRASALQRQGEQARTAGIVSAIGSLVGGGAKTFAMLDRPTTPSSPYGGPLAPRPD